MCLRGLALLAVLALGASAGAEPAALAQRSGARSVPSTALRGTAARTRLAALPLAEQAAISARLARGDRAFLARQVLGGYRLHGGGVTALLTRSGLKLGAGAESLTLTPATIGRGDRLRAWGAGALSASANRVRDARGDGAASYTGGPLGVEQAFVVTHRPRGVGGVLTLGLRIGGRLVPRLDARRGELSFGGVYRYGGLVVTDSRGRRLPAWLELHGNRLLIRVNDSTAAYPVRIDPFVEAIKLTANDGAAGDQLGFSVAISGQTVVAGAPQENSGQGAVYVFAPDGSSSWSDAIQVSELTASDGAPGDELGYSVAISGSTVIAGAPFATVGANAGQGAAYVFTGPSWSSAQTEAAKLTASDGAAGDEFGFSLAIDGSDVVVGAPLATDSVSQEGAIYHFTEPGGGWSGTPQDDAKLTASDAGSGDDLGASVGISGETVVGGAPYAAVGANTNQGAVYVFTQHSGLWDGDQTEDAKLSESAGHAFDHFGSSVAVAGPTVVAAMPDAGAPAFVFAEPTGGWSGSQTESASLTNTDHTAITSIATSGATVVAGGPDGGASGEGAAYVYYEPSGGWSGTQSQDEELTATDGAAGDSLGASVAIAGVNIAAGATGAAIGQHHGQGAGYVFQSSTALVDVPGTAGPAGSSGTGIVDTGVAVQNSVQVSASGTINVAASDFGENITPDGSSVNGPCNSCLAASLEPWSLLARIGSGAWQEIGSGPTTVSGTGEVYLAVNDDFYGDNSGDWLATVEPDPAAPVTDMLSVTKAGTGSGSVTSSPAGIDCGSTCSAEFDDGTQVTLTATPATGSTFAGWSGGGCSGTGTCQSTLSQDTQVTAEFDQHAPDVTTGSATDLSGTTATVTGLVDPNGNDTRYYFQYGKSPVGGLQTTPDDAGTMNGFVATATLTNLDPGTTYYYEIIAQQGTQPPVAGAQRTFRTLGPIVSTGAASAITASSATLSGTIDPRGSDTTYHFEYGTSRAYGDIAPDTGTDPSISSGGGVQTVTADLAGLDPNKTYHYRLVATNADGTSVGADQTFKTLVGAPEILSQSATGAASATGASFQVSVSVNTEGVAGQLKLNYGTDAGYGNSTSATLAATTGTVSKTLTVSTGVYPGVTYHYQLVATSSGGTTTTDDGTVTTPAVAPAAVTGSATDMGGGTVKLTGTVDPRGAPTTYYFQLTEPNVGCRGSGGETAVTATQSIAAGTWGAVPVSVTAVVPAGQALEYQLVATSDGGSSNGQIASISTSGAAPTKDVQSATSVTPTSAILNVIAQPKGPLDQVNYQSTGTTGSNGFPQSTAYPPQIEFQYGPTSAYGTSTPSVTWGDDSCPLIVGEALSGLSPGVTYHYAAFVVSDECHTGSGQAFTCVEGQLADATFTTAAGTTGGGVVVLGGGSVGTTVGCQTSQACTGNIVLTTTVALAGEAGAARAKTVVVGHGRFRVAGHSHTMVRIRLTPQGRRLQRKGRLGRVKETVHIRSGHGHTVTTSKTVRVTRARRRRKG